MSIMDVTGRDIRLLLQGLHYCEGASEQVFYDRENRQINHDPSRSGPITEDSPAVSAFCLWW